MSLSHEVLYSWVVNDAVHWHPIILFGDRKPHPAGDSKHPVIHLLHCCLTYFKKSNNTGVKKVKLVAEKFKTSIPQQRLAQWQERANSHGY